MKVPAFEIREVLKPGTKTPYCYDLYVDGHFTYGRKSVREYNWGAVELCDGQYKKMVSAKYRIIAMRKINVFDPYIHHNKSILIIPFKKAK